MPHIGIASAIVLIGGLDDPRALRDVEEVRADTAGEVGAEDRLGLDFRGQEESEQKRLEVHTAELATEGRSLASSLSRSGGSDVEEYKTGGGL